MSKMENRFDFKAWDSVNKKMLSSGEFTLKGIEELGWLPCDNEGQLLVTRKDPSTIVLLQYTGRTDRIGQKIFEGQLIKNNYGEIFEVLYEIETASFKLRSEDNPKVLLPWEAGNKMVIVGNIYEGEYFLEEN